MGKPQTHIYVIYAFLALLACVATPCRAALSTWIGGSADGPTEWSVGGNWQGGAPPGPADEAVIEAGAPTYPVLSADVEVGSLTIVEGARFTVNGRRLTVLGNLSVHWSGAGSGLRMVSAGDTVVVAGSASFNTGSGPVSTSVGALVAGVLHVRGDFTQMGGMAVGDGTADAQTFSSTGTRVIFDGAAPQSVFFNSAGPADTSVGGTAGSCFRDVDIANAAGVTFQGLTRAFGSRATFPWVTGDLRVLAGGALFGQQCYFESRLPQASGLYAITVTAPIHVTMDADATITGDLELAELTWMAQPVKPALTLNGHTLTVKGALTAQNMGQGKGLVLTNADDALVVEQPARFVGGSTASNLAAGLLRFQGDVEVAALGELAGPLAVAGSRVVLEGSRPKQMAGSFALADVEVAATAGVGGWSSLTASGRLIARTGAAGILGLGAAHRITCHGLDVDGLTVRSVLIDCLDGPIARFDNVRFEGFPRSTPNFDPALGATVCLALRHPGVASPLVLRGIRFAENDPGADDYFVYAADTMPDGVPLDLYMVDALPADGGAATRADDGARIFWNAPAPGLPPGAPTLLSPDDGATFTDAAPPFSLATQGASGQGLRHVVEFLRDGAVVATFDQTASLLGWNKAFPYAAGETATLSVGEALPNGAYEWRARAVNSAGAGPNSPARRVTLQLPLAVTGVTPNQMVWAPGAEGVFTIRGRAFSPDAVVELSGGGRTARATFVTWVSTTELTARVPLGGLTAGVYDVAVANAGGGGALTGAVTLAEQVRPVVEARLLGPGSIQASRKTTFWLSYTNRSSADISSAIVLLRSVPTGSTVTVNGETMVEGLTCVTEPDGIGVPLVLPGLRAGETSGVPVTIQAFDGAVGQWRLTVLALGGAAYGARLPAPAAGGFPRRLDGEPVATINMPWNGVPAEDRSSMQAVAQLLQDSWRESYFTNRYWNDACPGVQQNMGQRIAGLEVMGGWQVQRVDAAGIGGHSTTLVTSPTTGQSYIVDNYVTPCFLPVRLAEDPSNPGHTVYVTDSDQTTATQYFLNPIAAMGGLIGAPWSNHINGNPEWGDTPKFDTLWSKEHALQVLRSKDPNDKSTAEGSGSAHFVTGTGALTYTIHFENAANATGPAQEVMVSDALDTGRLDLSTLTLGRIALGDRALTPPPGARSLDTLMDLRPALNLLVGVQVEVDAAGVLLARLTALDPLTGVLPTEATQGLLPPGGQGSITFTVTPRAGLAAGSRIANTASIVFDKNEPILTPEWVNTIDGTAPTSSVAALPAVSAETPVLVSWTATDQAGASGVARVDLYASEDGGPYVPVGAKEAGATSLAFPGTLGHTYSFYCVAVDAAGNREAPPMVGGQIRPQATTRLGAARTFPAGVAMVALPISPEQTDPQAIFGVGAGAWMRWNPATSGNDKYARYPDAFAMLDRTTPGKGYWLKLAKARDASIAGVAPGRGVPVTLPLSAGWNMIGNPRSVSVAWSTTAIRVTSGAETRTLAQAAEAGWLDSAAWGWKQTAGNPQTGSYILVAEVGAGGVETEMKPWTGYWIRANRECSLVLPALASTAPAASGAMRGWVLAITAEAGGAGSQAFIGSGLAAAIRAADPPAAPTAEAPVPLIRVAAGQWRYAADLRVGSGTQAWEFEVTVPAATEQRSVTLRWPGSARLPRSANLTLTDVATGERLFMRMASERRFTMPAEGGIRRFRVEMLPSGQMLRILDARVLPGRAAGAPRVVTFALSQAATVRVSVLAGGRRIRALGSRAGAAAGTEQVIWDGRDDRGASVPAGLYLVELTATTPDGQMARQLLPAVMTR